MRHIQIAAAVAVDINTFKYIECNPLPLHPIYYQRFHDLSNSMFIFEVLKSNHVN